MYCTGVCHLNQSLLLVSYVYVKRGFIFKRILSLRSQITCISAITVKKEGEIFFIMLCLPIGQFHYKMFYYKQAVIYRVILKVIFSCFFYFLAERLGIISRITDMQAKVCCSYLMDVMNRYHRVTACFRVGAVPISHNYE
jgi:hypothetical protein